VDADADIVGDGVRVAAWVQTGMITLLASAGLFTPESASAIKELGGGLVITNASLSIALLVPLARQSLPPIDAILGALVLDALGNAMAIQLATKETLAARWQVCMCIAGQAVGLVALGLLVTSFSSNLLFTNDSCRCFWAFWWAWSTNCDPENPNTAFWIYYALRCVMFLYRAGVAFGQMQDYDDAKKWDEENPCVQCWDCVDHPDPSPEAATTTSESVDPDHYACRCAPCQHCRWCDRCGQYNPDNVNKEARKYNLEGKQCRCQACRKCKGRAEKCGCFIGKARFSAVGATRSVDLVESAIFALISLISLELTMAGNQVQKTAPIYSVGQVTALVVAGITAVRAAYLILTEHEDRKDMKISTKALAKRKGQYPRAQVPLPSLRKV